MSPAWIEPSATPGRTVADDLDPMVLCSVHYVAVGLPTADHGKRGLGLWTRHFSAFAALAGSVIGGLTSLGTSWLTQHSQLGAQRFARNLERRETLYKDFIDEASRLYVDALEHEQTEISNLVKLFAMVSQMRVVSSPRIVEDADKVVHLIIATYLEPNKALGDLESTLESHMVDPLRRFSEACREELQQIGAF